MAAPSKLIVDPDRLARRRAFAFLGTAAMASALVGLLFVMIWKNYVEGLEPEYFREQGINWGKEFQRRIRSQTNRFLASAQPFEVENWRENLDRSFLHYFDAEFRRNPTLRPRQIALLFKKGNGPFQTAAPIGKGLDREPPGRSFRHDQDSGLDVAVLSGSELVEVVVDGPVDKVGPEIGDSLRFHLVLEFRPFHLVTGRGTTYAALLVIVYLAVIYLLFIFVFRLGRRQMKLALSAKEKSIRLKAISSVAEGIAHEVRNPLNAISLNVQYLEKLADKTGHTPQPGDYQRIYRELGKLRKVIDNFVNFAKSRDLAITRWSMGDAVSACLQDLQARATEEGVTINRDDSGDLELAGDRPKITQVLTNLLENAIDALDQANEKTIDLELSGSHDLVCLAIRNHGATPDDEVMKNMFDPYFTTRSASLGLGLTLAKTVIESHGGRIQATAAPGGGLLVTITLPKEF